MDILDHLNVDKGGNMKLNNNELKQIKAGATISATLINALVRGVNSLIDVGRYFGSSIRRWTSKGKCPLK